MTDQTQDAIPQPENTDNIFLKIVFNDAMTEEQKNATVTKLVDPANHFKSNTHEEIMQQLEYAKGYLQGAVKRTPEEETAFVRGLDNMFFQIVSSGRSEQQKLKLVETALTDPGARAGSPQQMGYERRLQEYEFLVGYLEGKQELEKAAKAGFNKAAAVDKPEPPAPPEPAVSPLSKTPRVQNFLNQLHL